MSDAEEVMRMFDRERMAPSEIDAEMRKRPGYARDRIVAWWKADAEGLLR